MFVALTIPEVHSLYKKSIAALPALQGHDLPTIRIFDLPALYASGNDDSPRVCL